MFCLLLVPSRGEQQTDIGDFMMGFLREYYVVSLGVQVFYGWQ